VVEGAQDSTLTQATQGNIGTNVDCLATPTKRQVKRPSTTVRSLRELQWSPSPAIAGAESVPGFHFTPLRPGLIHAARKKGRRSVTDEQRLDWLRLIRSQNVGPRGIMARTPQAYSM